MEGAENIMSEERKSKAELLQELKALRQHICELEQANQAHQNFERQFKELFETTPVGIYRTTPDGRIIMANAALIKMLGYSSFEELSQRYLEKEGFAPGYPRSAFKDLIKKEGKVVGLESAWKRRDGTTLFIIENARAVRDELGKILYYEGMVQDITERKKVEQALIKSHEYANSLLDTAPEPIAITDLNGRIQQVNNAFERNSGRKRKELIGKTPLELGIMPEEEFQKIKSVIIPRLMKEGYTRDFETIATQKDGTKAHVLISWTLLKNAEGKPIGVITIGRDITERKQMENELKESEQRFRSIFDNAADGILLADVENKKFHSGNKMICQMLGYTKEELKNLTVTDIHPKQNLPYVQEQFEGQVRGQFTLSKDIPVKRKDGSIFFADINSFPITLSGKTYLMGIFRDITERKKMEEALRESQRWQRAILDSIPDMAWLKDKESKYIAANEALCKAFGIKSEDFVGKTDLDISPKDLAEKYRTDDHEVIKSGKRKRIEEQWGKKKGERIWIETIKTPIYNDQGQVIGTSGIARDVTGRKKLERALIESESKHRALVEQIPAITYTASIDEASTTTYVSPQIEQILGFSPSDYRADPDIWRKQLHPEDQKRVLAELKRCHETGEPFSCEYRMLTKSKQTVWLRDEARIAKDDKGNPIHLQGVMYDITERKNAEERIRTLISAIEQSIDGIAIADLEPRLLYVNKAYARMHGFSPQEMIGMPVEKLHNEEQKKAFKVNINRIKNQGFWEGEIGHIKKDGTPFPTYMSVTLLKDSEGKPIGILAVARDITELKQREKEFDDYRQKMTRAEKLASLGTLGAGLAHELTQPLTVITLLIENLLTDMEGIEHPGAAADKLRDALNEVSKVTSIMRKFRSAVRKSSERVVSQVNLKAVAQRTIELFDESVQRAKVTLDITGLDKLPNIYSSEEEIEQLFFALVENAIHAADNEKGCRLVISGAVKDNYVELQFSDNCSGIAPENINKIFEPFFTTKPIGAATGLGLCIVEHIVSRSGGKVHIESKLGEGTTFYVTLPIKRHAKLYPK